MKRSGLTHPKMLDLASRLGIPRLYAVGIIEGLLDWVADYAPEGNIGKWPDGTIALAAEWSGDPAEFVNSLVEAGWLDSDPKHRLLVHDWEDHCERWVRAKLARENKTFAVATTVATVDRTIEATTVATVEATAAGTAVATIEATEGPTDTHTEGPIPLRALTSLPLTSPSLTSLTIKEASASCTEPEEPASVPEGGTVLVYPVVGKGQKEWALTQSQIDRFKEYFPDLDVLAECRSALAWCDANPTRRKTPRGMSKFLTGWLEKSQNNGWGRQSPPSKKSPAETIEQKIARWREKGGANDSAGV